MVSPSSCATLRVTAKRAENLKNLQTMLDQDPFVKITVLPWGDEAQTRAASGVNPTWKSKHHNVMEVSYPGRAIPPEQAELLVEVYDAEVTRAARIIGSHTVNLADQLRLMRLGEATEVALTLRDPKGKGAGTVFLDMEIMLRGTIEVTVKAAHQLKNVQVLFEQDPYAQITLLSEQNKKGEKKTQVKSTKAASGTHPVWTKKHRNKLKFKYQGEDKPRFLIQVFDQEVIQKDRLLGTGALDLVKKVLSVKAAPELTVSTTVELVDEDFVPAGRIELDVHFVNEAYDEKKQVVRALSSQDLSMRDLNKFNGIDILKEFRRAFFHMEGEMEASAPDFLHELGRSGVPVSVLFITMWVAFSAIGLVVLLTRGAKLLSLIVAVLFPCYSSFKAIESEGKDDDTAMLTYWMIFGIFMLLDETAFKAAAMMQPGLYYLAKMAFLVWLAHPSTRGSAFLYNRGVAPLLRRYEARIDNRIAKAKKKVKEIDEQIRLEPEGEAAVNGDTD